MHLDTFSQAQLDWQIGNWKALTKLDLESIEKKESKSKLALMQAVAWMQISELEKANESLALSKQLGVTYSEIIECLTSSVYDTLANAEDLLGNVEKALGFYRKAISEDCESVEWSKIRRDFQRGQILNNKTTFECEKVAEIALGEAWAGNTVNTVIFRSHGIFTAGDYQYTAFYVDAETLRIVKRHLKTNDLETSDVIGQYNLKDAHNSISLGIDRQGHLHISYDHHGSQLNYRRSEQPYDIQTWSDELPMTGSNEQKVTYPTFILPVNNSPLLILYRDGNWKQGTAYLKYFDEALESWFDYPQPILSGADNQPLTSNAYWNHPVRDSQGNLHLSFSWRIDYSNDEQLINNLNIDYAKSYDDGFNWFSTQDQPLRLPMTQINSETIWPIPPGSNHINQTSMAVDSKGYPHIVFYMNDAQKIPQYHHLWFDGKSWHCKVVSDRIHAFNLSGGGTLEIPMSRPEIVIDKSDNVYVIYRADNTDDKLAATLLPSPDYDFVPRKRQVLVDQFVDHAEPIVDKTRWQQEEVLSLLVQANQQPNGDVSHNSLNRIVSIIDIEFNREMDL
jgi:hypothetical protein